MDNSKKFVGLFLLVLYATYIAYDQGKKDGKLKYEHTALCRVFPGDYGCLCINGNPLDPSSHFSCEIRKATK